MIRLSKRMKNIKDNISVKDKYNVIQAFDLLKKLSKVKFNESIDVSIRLGVDPRKSDQLVKGFSFFPHNIGKILKIAVIAQGESSIVAKKNGADIVGDFDLVNDIKNGKINFDLLVVDDQSKTLIEKLGTILGPKGLMPSYKYGTITKDIKNILIKFKNNYVKYKVDKFGVIHSILGNVLTSSEYLKDNLECLLHDLRKNKPNNTQGNYFKNIVVSSTMGPGLLIDINTLHIL